jgi:hypothetical protein
MEDPFVPISLDPPDVATEARHQRRVEGNDPAAGCVLEALLWMFIGDPDRHDALAEPYIVHPELGDLLGPGSGRQQQTAAVELMVISLALALPPWSEDSL